jgi:hypothetical protein
MVDHAHKGCDGVECNHLHAHVYHEGIGKKGANNVASLIIKTLKLLGLLDKSCAGSELNIIFDNCTGQNKNNTVLKLLVWLTEMGYFADVNFVFLVVGHTKNAADKLFNNLKMTYRKVNVHTMDELFKVLNVSGHVTVHPAEPDDFHDWKSYLNLFYSNFSQSKGGGLIKQNHIFTCNYSRDFTGNNLNVNLRKSNLEKHQVQKHRIIRRGFYGRKDFPNNAKGLKDAIAARPGIMKEAIETKLTVLEEPGINVFKQVELATKFRKVVPLEVWEDELYVPPSTEIMNFVKGEKARRKEFRSDLNTDKKKVQKKELAAKKEKREQKKREEG